MSTESFIGGLTLKIGDGADPEVFTAIEEMTDISGFGQTNALSEATHYGSGGFKEYIAGLADGQEITVTCNKVQAAAQQAYVQQQVRDKKSGNVQLELTDGTTAETFDFRVVFLSWGLAPSLSEKNGITFTMKITGDITQS